MPALNRLSEKSYDVEHRFGDLFHFVHVYIVEPHPKRPDPTPYEGWDRYNNPIGTPDGYSYSTMPQARNYGARRANALSVADGLNEDQLLLLDDLSPGALNNPVWSTYGTAPNPAFLIDQTGMIREAELWTNPTSLEKKMRQLIDEASGAQ